MSPDSDGLGKLINCELHYQHRDLKGKTVSLGVVVVGESVGSHSCRELNAFQRALYKTPLSKVNDY